MPAFWRALAALIIFASQWVGGVAQTTDAQCIPFFNWMSNSQHQSPCLVAASLLAVCNNGSYNVEALPESTHYLGPLSSTIANSCQCNTVVYSLMSACGSCQGRSYIPWSQWTANCPSVSTGFPMPLPTGLHVPGWAYLDPRPSDNFDQLRAQQSINLTESVVLPPPVSTASSVKSTSTKKSRSTSVTHRSSTLTTHAKTSSTSVSITPSQVSVATSSAAATPSSKHANMIGGIAVGCSVAGLCLITLVIWLLHRRLGRRNHGIIQLVSPVEEKPPQTDVEYGPRVIIEEPEEDAEQAKQHMRRYVEATVPPQIQTPSSATGTLPTISIHTISEPPSPTRRRHGATP